MSKDLGVRAIFVKHSMEKSEELELFDTDAIIEELEQKIAQETNKARIEELQKIPQLEVKDEPGNAARHIIDRIAQLTADKEQAE